MRDIFSELIDDLDKDTKKTSKDSSPEGQIIFALPESVRPYIPERTWRRLTEKEDPRRGLLLNALDRVRSTLYLVSTYLPQHIVQQKMRRPVSGATQGSEVSGTLLFSDVSGFTALSERLAVLGNEGAEKLTQIMNGYFENMLDILARSGGVLLKFAGDATLVFFEQQDNNQQAAWAVRTGQRMMRAMSAYQTLETPLGIVSLKMKIGISTGRFLEAHIGSAERMEYVVIGQAVRRTIAAEGVAEAGMVVIDEETVQTLTPESYAQLESGFFVIRAADEDVDDFEVRAGSRRARSGIPWSASPQAIAAQMEVAARQIECLTPYLAQELVDNIITHAGRRKIASEFRPTSVIFCNFTGFEAFLDMWGRIGVRRVALMMSEFFEAMHKIIDGLGGVVTRIDPYSNGSKMLILFGAPTAHEDDPERAVSAAIAMRAKLMELNKAWRKKYSRQLKMDEETADTENEVALKIGITHGLTFAGQVGSATRREYTVMGDDVNLSARLMSAAKSGQILINEPVFQAVKDHFHAEPLAPIRVKGKSNLIPIFELREKRAAQSYQDEQRPKPIFGRSSELAEGLAVIEQAMAGQGQHLQIQGTAGIGKSHLAEVFYTQSRKKGAEVRLTHCHSFTSQSPYAAWIYFIRSLTAINELESSDSAGQKLADLLERFDMTEEQYSRSLSNLLGVRLPTTTKKPAAPATPKPTASKPAGGSLFSQLGQKVSAKESRSSSLDLSNLTNRQSQAQTTQLWQRLQTRVASRERARLFAAVFHLLCQYSAQKPLLLFLENAQWLDPASKALFDFIGEKLVGQPILILSIHRSLTNETEKESSSAIPLGPLSLAETAEMVNHLSGKTAEPTLVEAIYNQSRGNPLFVREMVYWLERNRGDGLQKNLAGSLESSLTIQELILSRIDSLPVEARDTLKSAAIIGNTFRHGELVALLQAEKKQYGVPEVMKQLESSQIIAETSQDDASNDDDPTYTFQQPLMREIIYNSQSFSLRRQSHRTLAQYLEQQGGGAVDQQADLLAYHYEQAAAWTKAGRFRYLAAQQAQRRFAYDLAANSYGQGLALLTRLESAEHNPDTISLMAKCHQGQGDMALLTEEMTSAAYAYLSAFNILHANGQTIPPGLKIKIAQTLPVLGRAVEAEASLREVLEQPLSSKNLLAATATLAWLLWRSEQAEATLWLNRTRALIEKRPNDPWETGISALVTEWTGNLEEALKAYKAFEDKAGIILTSCRLGDQMLAAGDVTGARRYYESALKTAEEQKGQKDQVGEAIATGRIQSVDTGEPQPETDWQTYDDAFRISLLFNGDIDI
jgi:class 3 adenylate cyclase